jgi:hypothetical protein
VKVVYFFGSCFHFLPFAFRLIWWLKNYWLFRPSIFLYKYMAKDSILYRIVVKVNMVLTKGFICTHSIFLLFKKPLIMRLSFKLNKFYFSNYPPHLSVEFGKAWWEGCVATVKHRWINQNPFNSMYFAVQAMAAELSTGL